MTMMMSMMQQTMAMVAGQYYGPHNAPASGMPPLILCLNYSQTDPELFWNRSIESF